MKIYLFNLENGLYMGEDFADEATLKGGDIVMPPDATTVAPPQVGHGQVPVFNAVDQRWEVRSQSDCGTLRNP